MPEGSYAVPRCSKVGSTLTAPSDWWRTFFSGMVVESWLKATTAEQTRQEADFIVDVPIPAAGQAPRRALRRGTSLPRPGRGPATR